MRFFLRCELGRGDLALGTTVFVIGALVGSAVLVAVGPGFFYQTNFGPAVSLVCGRGFHNIAPSAANLSQPLQSISGHLLRFLESTSGSFTCPRSPAALGPMSPPNGFARLSRYLLYCVVALWKVFGISWVATYPLFAVLYGLASAASYWICRLFVSRIASLAVAVAFLFSPLQEQMLPQLRDYSAAPFILIAIAAIAIVIWNKLTRKQLIILAGVVGLELGIGFGFRTDMTAALPPFLATVILTQPLRSVHAWKTKALAVFACLATFAIAALGVLPAYLEFSNAPFVALEGNTPQFTAGLNLQAPELYDAGYLQNDQYNTGLINAYSHLIENKHTDIQIDSRLNDATAASYYLSIVRQTPGDYVVRGIASTAGILELGPESFGQKQEPTVVASLASGVRAPLGVLHHLPWSFAIVPGLAGLIVLWRDYWRGILWILVVVYFGVVNIVQFQLRRNFYFEIFWWLSCALVVECTVRTVVVHWKSVRLKGFVSRHKLRRAGAVAAIVAAVAILATGGLAVARLRQDENLGKLFSSYQTSPRTELRFEEQSVGDGDVLLTPSGGQEFWSGGSQYKEALLAATFGGASCDSAAITPVLKYRVGSGRVVSGGLLVPPPGGDARWDFSTTVPLSFDRRDPVVTKYFVVVKTPWSYFSGVDGDDARCLDSLAVLTETTRLSTLLDATLPTHWESARRYQAFDFESSEPLFPAAMQLYGDTRNALPSQ